MVEWLKELWCLGLRFGDVWGCLTFMVSRLFWFSVVEGFLGLTQRKNMGGMYVSPMLVGVQRCCYQLDGQKHKNEPMTYWHH